MPTMRTVPKAVKEYKKKDPDTRVTTTALRRWIKEGHVTCVMSGQYPLVNMESLENFLSGVNQ